LDLEGSLADQQTDAQAAVARLTAEVDRAKKAADEAHIALELGHGGRAEAEEALQQLTQVQNDAYYVQSLPSCTPEGPSLSTPI